MTASQSKRFYWKAAILCAIATLLKGMLTPSASAEQTNDFSLALKCYQSGAYSKARVIFARLADERPNDIELNFYLGRLAWWLDDDVDSVSHLERAASLAPRHARIQNALGDAYGVRALNVGLFSKLGWAKKCLAAHELAVRLAPTDVECRWGLLGYYFLAPAIAGGGNDKAFAQATAIRDLDPMAGHIAFATLFLQKKENSAAFAEFSIALKTTPNDFVALYQIGRCAALSGEQLQRGASSLQRCLELTPPMGEGMPTYAYVHYRLANILEKQGDKTAADQEYALTLSIQPDFNADKIGLRY